MATKKPAPIMIPAQEDEMIGQIYTALKARRTEPMRLSRLGASSIGDECLRKVWMAWRGYDRVEFDGRMLRLFETGHLQEERLIRDLKEAGYQVYEKDSNGEQFTFTDKTGHFVVKLDGVVKGVPNSPNAPHVLEAKTHNKKSFDELEKKGVVISKPSHYYQIQAGMLFSGIERGLYLSLNKDNEALYVRRIKPDEHIHKDILKRIDILVNSEIRPARIGESDETYPCRWCDYKEVCFDKKPPLKNCRTCENSRPIEDGKWYCDQLDIELTQEEQLSACGVYSQKGR